MSEPIRYICRGPRVPVNNQRQKVEERLAALRAQMEDLRHDLRKPIKLKIQELARQLEEPAIDYSVVTDRAGCGVDLSEQIAAIPADGDVYIYTCPTCGNTGTARKAEPRDETQAEQANA